MTEPLPPTALHATEFGEQGPRVVFLHGLFGQGKNWTSVARALAPDHRVLLLDLPDHGRSPWTEHVSYPGMAAAVAAELRGVTPRPRGPWSGTRWAARWP